MTKRQQGGQIALLFAAILMIAGLLAAGAVRLGVAAAARASAQAAADATALAGAAEGRDAADQIAEANDAVIVDYVTEGDDVVVWVRRRGVTAVARARWSPEGGPDTVHYRPIPYTVRLCLPSAPAIPHPQ